MEMVTDFIFMGTEITADGDYSHEIKGHLLLGRKTMTNLDSVFQSRDITSLQSSVQSKLSSQKLQVFPVVTYRYESWTIKKDEC